MRFSTFKVRRQLLRLWKKWLDWTGRSGQTYFFHRVAEYREMWRAIAHAEGGHFKELGDDLWEVEIDSVSTRVHNHELEFDNPVVLSLAGNKAAVHRLLGSMRLPIPEYALFSVAHAGPAEEFLRTHPKGCVVKPVNGYGGQGVTTHVQRPAELRSAILLASLYGHELIIEAMIPGESYRLLVLEGKMVHAVCRRGPRLRGNGTSTVQQLVETENAVRRSNARRVLDVDRDCVFTLGYQGLSLDSTPQRGQEFLLKSINDPDRKYTEVRTVYTDTVTTLVCPSIRSDAERAASLVGSEFLGVDIITTDLTVPLRDSGGVINEVNTTPALHHHYDASQETYPAVARQALKVILRKKAALGIPVR